MNCRSLRRRRRGGLRCNERCPPRAKESQQMSTLDEYQWRETYFVFFPTAKRPLLDRVQKALAKLNGRFEFENQAAGANGEIESLTLHSREDYSALEISFESGDEVCQQAAGLIKELSGPACAVEDKQRLTLLKQCDARLDVMHFEQMSADVEEMFDPGALLLVLEALARLTGGVGVDPQSGALI